MDENVPGYCGDKVKWVKRINWMDSRKISLLNAAQYKDAASAKPAAPGAWRHRRRSGTHDCTHSVTWEHLSKAKMWLWLHPTSSSHPDSLTWCCGGRGAHHSLPHCFSTLGIIFPVQWPWTFKKTFCTLSKHLEHYVQIEVFYIKC